MLSSCHVYGGRRDAPRLQAFFSFFNGAAPTVVYTLSLHDALPIYLSFGDVGIQAPRRLQRLLAGLPAASTPREPAGRQIGRAHRLNSSHTVISYAVFCLKKKKKSDGRSAHPVDTKADAEHAAQPGH